MARSSEATRRRILSVALALFRERGFQGTTMRQIAKDSGLSLGAAYHYFEGKHAIVRAYYEQQQRAHEEKARAALSKAGPSLKERLSLVLHLGFDVRAPDRELMRELAPLVVGPDAMTNAFSGASRDLRLRSIQLYREVLTHPDIPEDLRDTLALAFWALSMGLLLYYAHDESPRQHRSRVLVDESLELSMWVTGALSLGPLAPMREKIRKVLDDAGLLETR